MEASPSMSLITSPCFEGSGVTWRFPVSASSPANVPSGVLQKLVVFKSIIFSQRREKNPPPNCAAALSGCRTPCPDMEPGS